MTLFRIALVAAAVSLAACESKDETTDDTDITDTDAGETDAGETDADTDVAM